MSAEQVKKCQATTSEGDSCNNPAMYPKENPIACHIKSHQKQLGLLDESEDKEKIEKIINRTKKHIFSSKRLTHTIFVRYPEDDDRDYFRAEFSGGRWETDDDEKAELLVKTMNKIKAIGKALKKIQ